MFNPKSITVGILTNKKTSTTTLTSQNSMYKVYLNSISLSLDDFKNAFYPCNYFTPNEFVKITNMDYYTICNFPKCKYRNTCGNSLDACGNSLDACGNSLDACGNCLDACGNWLDACGNWLDACGNWLDACGNCLNAFKDCLDTSRNCLDACGNGICSGKVLSLYTETLSKFMEYNGILCQNTIEPRYLISFTNEVFKYNNFKDIPKIVTALSWATILHWTKLSMKSTFNIAYKIEFHYYDENFMPEPVIYVFQYKIDY